MNIHKSLLPTLASITLLAPVAEAASVSPRGVNVRSFGTNTIFLTYLGLNNQVPAEAFWCGAINANQSCVPGTVFGRLPSRYSIGRGSGGNGQNNYTDIMTIPTSVVRKAYQDAAQGNNSEFFYVRRWVSTTGGPDEFVAVTCRLSGGGARVPFSITSVKLLVDRDRVAPVIDSGARIPKFQAKIGYNGTGRLKGRWEVVMPGDPLPSERDLLTEASLPLEERGLQRRYMELQRFDLFLHPNGEVMLPGPDPARMPKGSSGTHLVLLRIEATDDREGNSDLGVGVVNSGGVAGFPMPIFRYFITANGDRDRSNLNLLEPKPNSRIAATQPIQFSWQGISGARGYKLIVKDNDRVVLSALLPSNRTSYNAPPWLKQQRNKSLNWRVQALDGKGGVLIESAPITFQMAGN
jgi:hypothetical protein